MICYTCHERHYGGLYAGHKEAVGICQNCGIGICGEHSQKAEEAGSPLLCLDCAQFLASETGHQTLQQMPMTMAAYRVIPHHNSENGKSNYNKRVREEIPHG